MQWASFRAGTPCVPSGSRHEWDPQATPVSSPSTNVKASLRVEALDPRIRQPNPNLCAARHQSSPLLASRQKPTKYHPHSPPGTPPLPDPPVLECRNPPHRPDKHPRAISRSRGEGAPAVRRPTTRPTTRPTRLSLSRSRQPPKSTTTPSANASAGTTPSGPRSAGGWKSRTR